MSRASGRTTRMVDNAIQHIFKNGHAVIPFKPLGFGRDNQLLFNHLGPGFDNNIIIDLDSHEHNFQQTQTYLADRIERRLSIEHTGQVSSVRVGNSVVFKNTL